MGLTLMSLPTRGAWIEILMSDAQETCLASLPTRGAWIEILAAARPYTASACRSPHGERGLKSLGIGLMVVGAVVAPHTGSVD